MIKNGYEFNSYEEFIDFCNRGGELEFIYNGSTYWTTMPRDRIRLIYEVNNQESDKEYNSPEEMLEYEIEGKKLKDILFDIEVLDRSF